MKFVSRTALAACAVLAMATLAPDAATAAEKSGARQVPNEKAVPEGKIEGIAFPQADGTWLGLSIRNQCFRLGFYDAHKMPKVPNCARAVARWHSKTKRFPDMTVLLPAPDGVSLAGNRYVQPPYAFRVFLTLIGPGDTVLATYTVDYHE